MKILTTAFVDGNAVQTTEDAMLRPDDGTELSILNIYPEETFQRVLGFGGAITEAAGYVYSRLPPETKQQALDAYFGGNGLGYTLGRCHLDSCDFCLGNYSADDDADDAALEHFSLARDERYVFPLIDDIQVRQSGLRLMLSPWSPPAYMKSNGSKNGGGTLRAEYRRRWAEYICRYVSTYQGHGYDVFAVSAQNEPNAVQTWDSCCYTPAEERDFVRDMLLPALKRNGLEDVTIAVWDHNKERLFDRVDTICSDAQANAAVGAAGFHWYSGDHFQALELVRRKYPDKLLIFTEGCIEYSRGDRDAQLQNARRYANELIGGFNAGMNAFLDWNLLLDDDGGPNHKENYCDAPVMASSDYCALRFNLSYHYIGHFSRFVLPGALRLGVTRFSDELGFAAFRNPNGDLTAVVLNRTDSERRYHLRINGSLCTLTGPAASISTILIREDEVPHGISI